MTLLRILGRTLFPSIMLLSLGNGFIYAGEDVPGVAERIGNTAKKVGTKIEQGVTKAATKLKEKKVGEKIEQKLKKAVTKTEEGFKKAGKKIDEKLR